MSEFGYIKNERKDYPTPFENNNSRIRIAENIESRLCDELEGIEEKPGFKLLSAILMALFSWMVFDILSNYALSGLLAGN